MDRYALLEWVNEEYGTEPEYCWASFPNFAVLRNPSGKWYAIVMDIAENKLGLPGERVVDVVNVKCDPRLIGSLRMQQGFFPAYHMNKEQWISILLDGTVADEELKSLIQMSYQLTGRMRPKKKRNTAET